MDEFPGQPISRTVTVTSQHELPSCTSPPGPVGNGLPPGSAKEVPYFIQKQILQNTACKICYKWPYTHTDAPLIFIYIFQIAHDVYICNLMWVPVPVLDTCCDTWYSNSTLKTTFTTHILPAWLLRQLEPYILVQWTAYFHQWVSSETSNAVDGDHLLQRRCSILHQLPQGAPFLQLSSAFGTAFHLQMKVLQFHL